MDKLLDYLQNVKYEINVDCFTKTNLPHIQPETLQLSVSVPMSHPFGDESEEEYHGKFVSVIVSDLSQSVVKTILKYIFNSGKKSFIDLTNRLGKPATQFENAASRTRKTIAKIYKCVYAGINDRFVFQHNYKTFLEREEIARIANERAIDERRLANERV